MSMTKGRIALLTLLSGLSLPASAQQDVVEAAAAPTPSASDGSPAASDVDMAAIPVQGPVSEDAGTPARERSASRLIEEVVVTAQKREENLQDVPISIQAFSADALDAKGIDDPKALQLTVPGLQYNLFAGYSLIYIRGVGTDAFIPSADASIATYIDNVYYPFGHSLASSFGAVERVEVLKGPQGTLFGRNSTGGAINIVTKDPGPSAETSVLISGGRFDQLNARVYTNMPIVDSLAVSVGAIYNTEENYYSRSADSPRGVFPKEKTKGGRLKLAWTPIDDLKVVLAATSLNVDGAQSMMLPATDVKPLGAALGVSEAPAYQTSIDAPVYISTKAAIFSGDIKYSTPWFDTRAIVANQHITSPALADYDGSSQPLFTFESIGQFADVFTGELQLLSNQDTPFADRFKWIAGLYYIDSSAGYDPLYFSAAPGALSYLAAPTGPLTGLTSPLISFLKNTPGVGSLLDYVDNGVTLGLEGVLDTKSTAGYFQGTYDITDWLAATLGGRYQVETRDLVKSNVNLATDPSSGDAGTRLIRYPTQSAHTSNFSPKAVLDFKPAEDQLVYLSYTQGFKSGTYNIINIYTPTQYIKPEKVTAYELGYKTTLLDGHLRFNTAVFQNTIKDLQVQTISLTSGGAVKFETAGGARIRGADFDATWEFLPEWVPGLVFTAGGAYLKGIYTSYKEGSGFDEQTGLYFDGTIFPNRDFTGNKVVRTPKFSGNSGLGYGMDVDSGSIEVAADVYYNSGFFYSAQNTETASEDSYYVLNARASYFHKAWGTRITAFVKNINGGKYSYVKQELDFGTANLLAPPRTYGLRLNWDF
ncbi:TonB-dependent receptor [Hydrocarboniphaga sp.]|uniref:TonB-dependent receptor n=1 Tax=Hydrocarboniphaga sp. TaxID=2033016 RepID=UPI003D105A4F